MALLVAVAAAVRAVEILLGDDRLEVVAPLGFVLLVVSSSVLLVREGGSDVRAGA
jgi:hypothetical protein